MCDVIKSNGLKILVLDDDPFDAVLTQRLLHDYFECVVIVVASRPELMVGLERVRPDLVISDSNVPGIDGLAALELIRQGQPRLPVIFCSGNSSPEMRSQALALGATAWVSKNDLPRLVAVVKRVCG